LPRTPIAGDPGPAAAHAGGEGQPGQHRRRSPERRHRRPMRRPVMRRALSLVAAILALPLSAFAAPVNTAECTAHLSASLASMTPERFAEELAGAEGMAGKATPAI